jgi:pimeloyl-ACP methyl ester carboxylesterase
MAKRRWEREGESEVPDWFWKAVETEREEHKVEVEECDVFYQLWGDASRPGLLFIHGWSAHSHWWDFIIPHLLDEYRCAAMDLTGMGDSDYRYDYDVETYAQEIVAVCDDAGFGGDVFLVAHSFGGAMAVKAANLHPDRFQGLILVDSGIRSPDEERPEAGVLMGGQRAKAYPSREEAQRRFRLQPPQPCENQYIVDYIARTSVMPAEGGWAWKFDEDLRDSLSGSERYPEDYQQLSIKLGLIYGEESRLFTGSMLEYMRTLVPKPFPAVAIPGAQHHVFLDKPLEFVEALGQMLAELRD